MSSATYLIPLNMLAPGKTAEVDIVVGSPEDVHRLEEMGLRSGATIEMVETGSPCVIRIGGQKLCFRAAEDLISVVVRCGVDS